MNKNKNGEVYEPAKVNTSTLLFLFLVRDSLFNSLTGIFDI